jgi:hypothetical protein
VDLEDPIIPPYYGPLKACTFFLSIVTYMPFRDLIVGNFVFMRPLNLTIYPIWMGKAENDVVRSQNNDNYRRVYV